MKGHKRTVVVECADCGRLYRAVGDETRPSADDLTCHCGSNSFVERTDLVGVPAR